MVQTLIGVMRLLQFFIFVAVASAAPPSDEKVHAVALLWLQLIDEKKYEESWEQAADYFRNAVPAEEWKQLLAGFRGPLGDIQRRKLVIDEETTSLPGAPDGRYHVLQFSSTFANKELATETVTLMRGEDGIWRAAGYFIK